MGNLTAKPNQKDLVFMKELLEAGKVVPVIDRCYPLSEVAEAIRYLEEGHARGKVLVAIPKWALNLNKHCALQNNIRIRELLGGR